MNNVVLLKVKSTKCLNFCFASWFCTNPMVIEVLKAVYTWCCCRKTTTQAVCLSGKLISNGWRGEADLDLLILSVQMQFVIFPHGWVTFWFDCSGLSLRVSAPCSLLWELMDKALAQGKHLPLFSFRFITLCLCLAAVILSVPFSSLSQWVHACDALELPAQQKEQLDSFIDQLYKDIDKGHTFRFSLVSFRVNCLSSWYKMYTLYDKVFVIVLLVPIPLLWLCNLMFGSDICITCLLSP